MKNIPLKQCPKCSLYHDISVEVCKCGTALGDIPAKLIHSAIPAEQCGTINESLPVYAQFCTYCGTYNFTADPQARALRCYNCSQARIARTAPKLFTAVEESPAASAPEDQPPAGPEPAGKAAVKLPDVAQAAAGDDEARRNLDKWLQRIGNGRAEISSDIGGRQQPHTSTVKDPAEPKPMSGPARPQQKQPITFTAVRGGFCKTVLPEQTPLEIGRECAWCEFLTDGRVSGKHFTLICRDDGWYLKDHSSNGTIVNNEFVNHAEKKLENHATVHLSRSEDCPEFIVEIG